MIIFSRAETMVGVEPKRVKLNVGRNNVDIDYKNPVVERQLFVLRKIGAVVFQERLLCDIKRPEKNKEVATKTEQSDGCNIGCGTVSEQTGDEGPGCSEVPERRDGYDSPKPVRRTRRKKKQRVEKADTDGA